MAPAIERLSQLSNPLATVDQLASSGSQLDGIPSDLEDSIRFAGARLTQAAGILLRLPQDTIAQAIILFSRFFVGSEGGSFREYGARDVSAAVMYLVAKLSMLPKSPRSILNAYAYLDSLSETFFDVSKLAENNEPDKYVLSEGDYQAQRITLMKLETQVLRVLGFQTHVALPYTLSINYLQTLDVFRDGHSKELAKRTFAHLTSALLNPQLLYLTHQPSALATAAIYLAAREIDLKLPGEEWWEVFDVDREELGFLVVAFLSLEAWVADEKQMWQGRKIPLTVAETEKELQRREKEGRR